MVTITRVEAIPILVPLTTGLTTKTAHGEHIDSPYVVVRVHTDEGITGLRRRSSDGSLRSDEELMDLLSRLLKTNN